MKSDPDHRPPGLRFEKARLFRPFFASDVFYLVTGFIGGTSLTYTFIISASLTLNSPGVPRFSALDLPGWVAGAVALLLLDLGNDAAHWLMHRYDRIWDR